MRVEIKIDPGAGEPFAVIHAPRMTAELTLWAEMLERAEGKPSLLPVKRARHDDKIFLFESEQVELIRTEGSDMKLYNQKAQAYFVTKPLHEIGERLGAGFVRISKSAIVNLNRVDHLSPSFNGTMYIVMKNGISDYISRKYLGEFKKRLGL